MEYLENEWLYADRDLIVLDMKVSLRETDIDLHVSDVEISPVKCTPGHPI